MSALHKSGEGMEAERRSWVGVSPKISDAALTEQAVTSGTSNVIWMPILCESGSQCGKSKKGLDSVAIVTRLHTRGCTELLIIDHTSK
jgi:hypothetical protein